MIELRVRGAAEGEGIARGEHSLSIGRAWTNDLVLHDAPKVSGRHGQLEEVAGGLRYRDLGSRNGSAVLRADGTRVECEPGGEAVAVEVGDTLLLGGAEDAVAVAIATPAAPEPSAARLLTTLAADRPLLDVARLTATPGAGPSFTAFLASLVGALSADQVQELLAQAVRDNFPTVRQVDLWLAGGAAPPADEALVRRVRDESEAVVFEDRGGAGAGFAAPLRGPDRTVGVLVARVDGDPPDEETLRLAQTFAHYAGGVLAGALERRADADRIAELEVQNEGLRRQLEELDPDLEIVGNDPGLLEALQRARQVASYPTPVLITGPTGTGKELVARAIHRFSDRREAPFLAVNCGALPENLLESELFGHEKGSFTGADRAREGLFQTADGGTLFLDEVGEIPLALQVKLLRVLQEGELYRVGSSRPVTVDVRVLAATHRRLEEEVREGRFREDLLYRLNVFPVELPALRERPGDVALLAAHFAQRVAARFGRPSIRLSARAVERLTAEVWPGNVRELQNRIERAVILCGGEVIEAEHVAPPSSASDEGFPSLKEAKRRFTREHVERALALAGGVQREAARLLELDPGNLSRLIRDLGLR